MARLRLLALVVGAAVALAGCTGGSGSGDEPRGGRDADGDGIGDATERAERAITIQGRDGPEERTVRSDPEKRDTDDDGLEDFDELVRGTDPSDADTDGDGLLDGHDARFREDSAVHRAWRDRGILLRNGTFLGELDQCPDFGGLKPTEWTSDRPLPDDLGDGEELLGWNVTTAGGTRHVASSPCSRDTDGDGLLDHDEKRLGSDPRDADTDGDGARDAEDADPLWNLGLRLDNFTLDRGAGPVRLSATAVGASQEVVVGPRAQILLDVPDRGESNASLRVAVILQATDAETGEPAQVFDDPRGGAIVAFDLVKGTAEDSAGSAYPPGRLAFEGDEGTLSFEWRVTRT